MELQVSRVDDIFIAALTGRFDVNTADAVEQRLRELLERDGARKLIIDMQRTVYMSSYGVRVLLIIAKIMRKMAADFALAAPSEEIALVLTTSGLAKFFAIYPDTAAAVAALRAGKVAETPDARAEWPV